MAGTTVIIVCVLSISWRLVGARFGPSMGPYDTEIKEVATCPDEGTGQVHFGSKISNEGKGKYTYSSPFRIGVPMDENFKGYVDVQKWGNGGYKPRFIEYTANNCEELWKYVGDFLQSLMKSAGVTVDKCPVPQGNYTADNWEVELKFKNVPVLPYNKYRMYVHLFYKNVKVGCQIILLDIVPKSFG